MDYQVLFTGATLTKIIAVIIILIIGYIVALIVQAITRGALKKTGFDRRVEHSPASDVTKRITKSPSNTIAKAVFWLVMIIAITIAIASLNVPVFNQFVAGIYGYIPNIIAALIILGIALALASGISGFLNRVMGDTPTGRIAGTVVPTLILVIAGFAILEELQIATTIVTITYAAIIGSLALGFALAFGLGGRGVAERLLVQGYDAGAKNVDQVREDIRKGRERTGKKVKEEKEKKGWEDL